MTFRNYTDRAKERMNYCNENKSYKMKDYSGVMKIDDSPLAYFIAARWANRLLPWYVEKGFSPNQVTALSLSISIVTALCFTHNSRWIVLFGSITLILSFVFDCLDGQLARYKGESTPFGFWLDIFGDRVRELMLWVCLCYGTASRTDENEIWMWGMLAAITLSLRFAEDLYREKAIGKNDKKPEIMEGGKKISLRVWIQRLFYFSIAERFFLLMVAAPLGIAELFFKIMVVGNTAMMIIFSTNGWWKERKKSSTQI